ncbi:hypothetical protein T484DRAFT_2764367 [Baffinella frigidus]|nr:hypothetical protein T484DRAFT_2764367 [Cryptophyta sp. CCMP2293]
MLTRSLVRRALHAPVAAGWAQLSNHHISRHTARVAPVSRGWSDPALASRGLSAPPMDSLAAVAFSPDVPPSADPPSLWWHPAPGCASAPKRNTRGGEGGEGGDGRERGEGGEGGEVNGGIGSSGAGDLWGKWKDDQAWERGGHPQSGRGGGWGESEGGLDVESGTWGAGGAEVTVVCCGEGGGVAMLLRTRVPLCRPPTLFSS